MTPMRFRRFATFALVMALSTGMLLPPAPAQALFESLSIKDEKKMGREFDAMIRAKMGVVGDPLIDSYVKGIVDKIVAAKRPMPFTIKSAVLANNSLNAFAIPGGYIYVFTGLIASAETESELAGVIAHELGHVSERHMARRLEKSKFVGIASMVGAVAGIFLGIAGGGDSAGKLGQALVMGSQAGAQQAMLNYSRSDERDADHVGMNSMVEAGYNPNGMPQMFEIMQKKKWFSGGGDIPSYLSTHPGLAERIGYLKGRIKRMPERFTQRKDDNTRLRRVQAIILAKLTPADAALGKYKSKPESEYTALDFMGRGIVLLRLKRTREAEQWMEKALAANDDDPLVLREAGRFYYKTGQTAKAGMLLQKAVFKDPKDALALFYLSLLQAENGDYNRAIPTMRKVLAAVPEDAEVHYYLGKILGESGDDFGGYLHLGYSELYLLHPRKARAHAAKAQSLAKSEEDKEKVEKLKELIQKKTQKGS
ncbi:M48 family metalloprotease [Pseudodesulfovibrio senegalensis]|nr:M48 family metalloprotease [Pseudodesulfovibrio senegalensis]